MRPHLPEVHVFLLAHQDDEFGAFKVIEDSVGAGHRPVVLYLTNGSDPGQDSRIRDSESLAVLAQLGVAEQDVHFVGSAVSIHNFELVDKLGPAYDAVRETINSYSGVSRLFMHAWEGGHPDHDGVHAIGVLLATQLGLLEQSRQFPVYHGARLPIGMFRLCSPLAANGPVTATSIPWQTRAQYLRLCLSYPSQLRTWIYFLPVMALFMLARGRQFLQPVSLQRIRERPHDGSLLYERRGWADSDDLLHRVAQFADSVT